MEVMGFIHDQNVPSRFKGLVHALLAVGEQREAAEDKLGFQKRIPVACGFATFFVVNVEPEIKPAKQLDKPLVHE